MQAPAPPPPPARSSHWPWAMATAIVAVVAIVTAGALYTLRSVRSLPSEVIDRGQKAIEQIGAVAAAFRTGTITTQFRSDATELRGTTRLQFAELKQQEVFERRDAEALLWGTLILPDVVIEARAPVEYTYYVDLDKEWRFRLEGRTVDVLAPPIEWNAPAVDVSALRYEVKAGSVFRSERIVQDRLRSELTALAAMRARQHVPLVREVARRRAEAFVENWLVQRFGDGGQYSARVVFADEKRAPPKAPVVPSPAG